MDDDMSNDEFTMPGVVSVTPEVLAYARDFAATVASSQDGRYVATFDWVQSIGVRDGKEAPLREIGPCLLLSGYERRDVPPAFINRTPELDYAVKIPDNIVRGSAQRVIEIDETMPFRLALR